MTQAPCSLVLHIGQHKTGSKALQSFLAHNRARLLDHQVLYPVPERPSGDDRAYAISHYRLFALVRREALADCFGRARADRYWRDEHAHCRPYDSARSLFEAVAEEGNRVRAAHIVMSAEDLFDMQTAHKLEFSLELVQAGSRLLADLASRFGYDARIVVHLRRQDHLLGAHYGQYIKGSSIHDVDFAEFASVFAPRLDSWRILSAWMSAFGRDRIRVRAYERAAGRIVPDFFEHALDLAIPSDCAEPAGDVESVNRSLSRDLIEYIRVLNRRTARSQPVFERGLLLEAALRAAPSGEEGEGIASWLSPAARRELLACHADGNDAIARVFGGVGDGRLFRESLPEGDEHWEPYGGLTPERATAISLAIHEVVLESMRAAGPA